MSEFARNKQPQQPACIDILDQAYGPIKLSQLLAIEPSPTAERIQDLINTGKIAVDEDLVSELVNQADSFTACKDLNMSLGYLELTVTLLDKLPELPELSSPAVRLSLSQIYLAMNKYQQVADTVEQVIDALDVNSYDRNSNTNALNLCLASLQTGLLAQYKLQDHEQIIIYASKLKGLSIVLQHPVTLVLACQYTADVYDKAGDRVSAISEIVNTYAKLSRFTDQKDDVLTIQAYLNFSKLCNRLQFYKEAHMLALESLRVYEKAAIDMPEEECAIYKNLSHTHRNLGQPHEAYEFLLKSFKLYKSLSDSNDQTKTWYRSELAEIKADCGDHLESIRLKKLILKNIIQKSPDDIIAIAEARLSYTMGLFGGNYYLDAKEQGEAVITAISDILPLSLLDILNGNQDDLEVRMQEFNSQLVQETKPELLSALALYTTTIVALANLEMILKDRESGLEKAIINYKVLSMMISAEDNRGQHSSIMHALAEVYFMQGQDFDALESCEHALENVSRGSKHEASIYLTRATGLLKQNEIALAQADITKAKEIYESLPRYKSSFQYTEVLLCQAKCELEQYELYRNNNHLTAAQEHLKQILNLCNKFNRKDGLTAMNSYNILAQVAEFSDNQESAIMYKNKAKTILALIDSENEFRICERFEL